MTQQQQTTTQRRNQKYGTKIGDRTRPEAEAAAAGNGDDGNNNNSNVNFSLTSDGANNNNSIVSQRSVQSSSSSPNESFQQQQQRQRGASSSSSGGGGASAAVKNKSSSCSTALLNLRHHLVEVADHRYVKHIFNAVTFWCVVCALCIVDPLPENDRKFLDVQEIILCSLFWVELILLLAGSGWRVYLRNAWNRVDFVASIIALVFLLLRLLLPDFSSKYRTISWCLRQGRLVKLAKGTEFRAIFVRFGDTLRSLSGVLALFLVFYFAFSVIASRLFGRVVWGPVGGYAPNHQNSFSGASLSCFFLLRLSLGGSWPSVWWTLRNKATGCDPNIGNCGPPTPIPELFFVVFVVTFTFILKNLLVAVAVDVFASSGDFRSLPKVDAQVTVKLWMITQCGRVIKSPTQLRALYTQRVPLNGRVLRFIRSLPAGFPTSPIWLWEALSDKQEEEKAAALKKRREAEERRRKKHNTAATFSASSSGGDISSEHAAGLLQDDDDDDSSNDKNGENGENNSNDHPAQHQPLFFKKRGLLEPAIIIRAIEVLYVAHQVRSRREAALRHRTASTAATAGGSSFASSSGNNDSLASDGGGGFSNNTSQLSAAENSSSPPRRQSFASSFVQRVHGASQVMMRKFSVARANEKERQESNTEKTKEKEEVEPQRHKPIINLDDVEAEAEAEAANKQRQQHQEQTETAGGKPASNEKQQQQQPNEAESKPDTDSSPSPSADHNNEKQETTTAVAMMSPTEGEGPGAGNSNDKEQQGSNPDEATTTAKKEKKVSPNRATTDETKLSELNRKRGESRVRFSEAKVVEETLGPLAVAKMSSSSLSSAAAAPSALKRESTTSSPPPSPSVSVAPAVVNTTSPLQHPQQQQEQPPSLAAASGSNNSNNNVEESSQEQKPQQQFSDVTVTFAEVADVLFHMAFMAPFAPSATDRVFNAVDMQDIRLNSTPEDWEEATAFAFELWLSEMVGSMWIRKVMKRRRMAEQKKK